MRKILTAVFTATLLIIACCGDPPSTPDLCAGITCGHGTCSPDTGKCVCDSGYSGDTCSLTFDTGNCLVKEVFGPSDSGKLEISGITGGASYLNGFYVDVPEGAVDRNALFCLMAGFGVNIPVPSEEHLIPGLIVYSVDPDRPLLPNGDLNKVVLVKNVDIFFNDNRGRVVLYEDGVFTEVTAKLLANGMLAATLHLSEFYLFDRKPVVEAAAQHLGNRVVVIDFTGTIDEGFTLPYLLQFAATGEGTPLALQPVDDGGLKFWVTLPDGQHTITAIVTDPYGNEDSKQVSVTDLCLGVTCHPWEMCREVDGVCIGSDPCDPNPCVHGTCDNSTSSAVCTCDGGWLGTLCDQQDLCYQITCSGHGTCKPSDGSCQCNTHWDSATSCATCTGNWDPAQDCNVCLSGYGGANCDPVPTISGLGIDLSSTGGGCIVGFTYPVSFNSTNSTSWSATVQDTGCGSAGTLSPTSGSIVGSPTLFNYITGVCAIANIHLTVQTTGPGGTTSDYINFNCY